MMLVKVSAKCFIKYAIGVFMSFFVVLSCVFIMTSVSGQTTGYDVYYINPETNKNEFLYHYDISSGEDTKYAEYENSGYELIKSKNVALSKSRRNLAYAIAIILSLSIVTVILYGSIWDFANKESSVVHKSIEYSNKFRGLKIGLIANIPVFVLYIVLLFCAMGIVSPNYTSVYAFLNSHLFGYLFWIFGDTVTNVSLNAVRLILAALPLVYLPLVCTVSYMLGHNDTRLFYRMMYKKK